MISPFQIEGLLLKAQTLRDEILRVRDERQPFSDAEVIYDALIEVLDSRSELVKNCFNLMLQDTVIKHESLLRTVQRDLELILEFLGYLERVDSSRIPFEVIKSLSWVASDLFSQKTQIALRLDSDYTYSFFSCEREFERNGWGQYWRVATDKWHVDHSKRPCEPPPTVWLLRLPFPDADSPLLHVLAAHEFGHEFAYRFRLDLDNIKHQVVSDLMRDHGDQIQNCVTNLVAIQAQSKNKDITTDAAGEAARRHVLDHFTRIVWNWVDEIFADLTAIRLVGPAFLAAFDRTVTVSVLASDSYPATWLRRSIAHDYLRNLLPAISSDPVWSYLFGECEKPDSLSDCLYQTVEQFGPSIITLLDPLLSRIPCPLARLAPADLVALINTAEDHIEHLAPPSVPLQSISEFAGAERFWVLMYAGWHYRLGPRFTMMEETYGLGKGLDRSEEVLVNLLVHAFQAIELGSRWNESRASEEQSVS